MAFFQPFRDAGSKPASQDRQAATPRASGRRRPHGHGRRPPVPTGPAPPRRTGEAAGQVNVSSTSTPSSAATDPRTDAGLHRRLRSGPSRCRRSGRSSTTPSSSPACMQGTEVAKINTTRPPRPPELPRRPPHPRPVPLHHPRLHQLGPPRDRPHHPLRPGGETSYDQPRPPLRHLPQAEDQQRPTTTRATRAGPTTLTEADQPRVLRRDPSRPRRWVQHQAC